MRILAFAELDSTNEEARRRAQQGAPHGTVILAGTQTKGRGRRGRHWVSPPGNLYCSLLLRPGCAPAAAANMSFVAALALGEAIAPLLPDPAALRFKWPNDVLVRGRKAAGILLESQSAGPSVEWLVVGVGVNVTSHPAAVEFPAIDLAAAGCAEADVARLVESFLARFEDWYGRWRDAGFAPVREAWLAGAGAIGEPVEVRVGEERLRGRFGGIDGQGALILELEGGRRAITAGDVFFPEAAIQR